MADNNDYIPIYTEVERPNQLLNKNFYTEGNRVESSAIGCIVTGDGNYVSHACANVSILNSSGCVVYEGITGTTILNSSGIIVSSSNEVYINNNRITSTGDVVTDPNLISSDYTATVNDDVILISVAGITVTLPDYSTVGGKKWYVKNISGADCYITTTAPYGFDNETPNVTTITLSTNEAYTLYAYYTWILIL